MTGSQRSPEAAPPGALLSPRGASWDRRPTSPSPARSRCLPQPQSGLHPSPLRKHKGLFLRKERPPRRPPVDSHCLPASTSAPRPRSTPTGPLNQTIPRSPGLRHQPVRGRASPRPGQANKPRLHLQPLPRPLLHSHSLPLPPPCPQLPLLCHLLRRQPLPRLGL